ncbi:MAG: ribonucleoside triphosphate reductase [Candidatus Marinimicrobia bacterium]|nr:ribonucleoside triphosphate reductase [Candidatus Neomarinimicrobiota bacterium]
MFQKIIKRNHEAVPFDTEKIKNAILKAGEATREFGEETASKLTLRVISMAFAIIKDDIPAVEQIQDIVEEVLLASPYKKTAKAYILYRDQHAKIRELVSAANADMVEKYINQTDWKVKENSNMGYSLQGLNNYLASELSKIYWLNNIYPESIKKHHMHGDYHIHDLSQLSVYCVGWDLADLIQTGFRGVSGKIESSPAKHFRSILGQIVNFFYTLQGEAAGAQAFSNFDTLLAPFIYYDKLSYKEVKQAMQEFVFNVNVPTRVGFQTPFTNITMDLVCPGTHMDQAVIVGGVPRDKCYGEFQHEMNIINRAFLEVMAEGDAKERVFTFPIPTYNITKDFDWDDPNLDYLWEITAKYGIPYFSNFINSDMNPEDARSMCCRLRLDNRILEARGGGLFGAHPLTGSIGVVTINMPRIGYLAVNEDDFLERLDGLMDSARESLEIKRKTLEKYTEEGLYPYVKFYLRNMYQRFNKFWKNHFSTIGLVGMNEAIVNLLGQDIASEKGQQFTLRIMDHMREKLIQYQETTGNNYNLEATPAEATSFRLAQLDKKFYPDIITANELMGQKSRVPYYTNSTHLPVNYTDDLFELLDLQDEIQTRYTGGTVVHLFGGERIREGETVKKLVKKICENYRLPYFTITPTFSICPVHGYIAGEHFKCARCGEATEVFSRVVGYLRPVNQWNDGKKAEFDVRNMFKMEDILS